MTTTKPMYLNYNGEKKNIRQLAITTVTSSLRTLKYRFNELDRQMKNTALSCLFLSSCSSSLWNHRLIIYGDIVGLLWQTLTPDLLTGCSACWWWRRQSRLCSSTPFMSVQTSERPSLCGPVWVAVLWFHSGGRLCFLIRHDWSPQWCAELKRNFKILALHLNISFLCYFIYQTMISWHLLVLGLNNQE